MKAASCFPGIGAPELGGPQFDWVWCAEVEKFPSAVLAERFPHSVNLGDVTADDFLQRASAFGPLDLLVGGPPCQSFSIAGLRKGMADPRGNLTLRYLAIIDALKPTFALFENVPGMLSDKTDAFGQLLDAFEEIGYVVDVDIHDAQWFGVAQRRRRIFVCAQRVDSILSEKTLTSAQTIAQLLAENLLLTLAVARGPSTIVSSDLAFDASDPSLSLRKRMKLFGLDSASEPASMLAERLGESLVSFECEPSALASENGSAASKIIEDIASFPSTIRMELHAAFPNIGKSWSATLAAPCEAMRSCTTSIAGSGITESTIFGCALATLHISERITRSTASLPTYWNAALSSLTALKAFIDYARQATSDLFADPEWVRPWLHFIREAEPASESLGNIGVECFGQVLPISESLSGNTPPRREAGARVAALTSTGVGTCGADDNQAQAGHLIGFAQIGTAEYREGLGLTRATGGDAGGGSELLIAHSLRREGFDASEDGTGRGTPIVPVPFDTTQITSKSNYSQPKEGDPCHPLAAGAHPPAIAFSSKDYGNDATDDLSPTLRSMGHDKSHANGGGQMAIAIQGAATRENVTSGPDGKGWRDDDCAYTLEARPEVQAVATAWQVRRLTPTECARLQGFPDDHCAIAYRGKPAADGPIYKSYGNSWAVPNGAWILARLANELRP